MNKNDIFKIGIGTWKIDPENFEKDLEALKYSFDLGQNYLPLSLLFKYWRRKAYGREVIL